MPEFAERRPEGLEDSRAAQDYLKAIYQMHAESGRATTLALALKLRVKPASVTAMVKRLADDPGGAFVTHRPYHGAVLTPGAEAEALEMIRHHRLLELFLTRDLGMSWDEVHEEADLLEHVISERLQGRVPPKPGQPHGAPP